MLSFRKVNILSNNFVFCKIKYCSPTNCRSKCHLMKPLSIYLSVVRTHCSSHNVCYCISVSWAYRRSTISSNSPTQRHCRTIGKLSPIIVCAKYTILLVFDVSFLVVITSYSFKRYSKMHYRNLHVLLTVKLEFVPQNCKTK